MNNNYDRSCREELAIVLPSLNPDRKFNDVVQGLVDGGFKKIIIVDDGSEQSRQVWFERAAEFQQCTVLHHGINKGKGRALKTAFSYIMQEMPEVKGAITIDGDGQHLLKDIIACGNTMLKNTNKVVLGCRDFNLPNVPPRSVAGNKFTSKAFRILFGIKLGDTQTGLRAIPSKFFPLFCEIAGERFEYETNMLLQMKRSGIEFIEQPIETVYDEEDYSSHYNAIKDSWKVGKVMIRFLLSGSGAKYLFSSVLSLILDYIVYYVLLGVCGMAKEAAFHLLATFVSSFGNFNLNKYWVFQKKGEYIKDCFAYYCVCVPRTLISTVCASGCIGFLYITSAGVALSIRIVVDLFLFVACYFIQKKWVFKKNRI